MLSSQLFQPPVCLCRRCGALNLTILVPRDFPFGEARFPGMELTYFAKEPFFHMDERALQQTMLVVRDKHSHAMTVMSAKRVALGFDPEDPSSVTIARENNIKERGLDHRFKYTQFDPRTQWTPAQVRDYLPMAFHCTYSLDWSLPQMASYSPEGRKHPTPAKKSKPRRP